MARAQKTQESRNGRSLEGAPANEVRAMEHGGPGQDEISRRAYELFLARGGEHGHDLEDWVQAERELSLGRYQ